MPLALLLYCKQLASEYRITCSLVSLDELVAHRDDVINRKLCRGVRIKHSRLVYVLTLAGNSRLNGKELRIDVGHIHMMLCANC